MNTCPQCGSSNIAVSETSTTRTHKCNKCGYSETQAKSARADRPGRAYAAGLAVMLLLAYVFSHWAGAA